MSAQVTEAHRELARRIMLEFTQAGTATASDVRMAAQIIADSEAKACEQLRAEVADQVARFHEEIARRQQVVQDNKALDLQERDQLRAERNNLRADLDAIKAIRDEETARAERAEAEVERLRHLEALLNQAAAEVTAHTFTAGGIAGLRAENERLRRAYVRPDDIRAQLESAAARASLSETELRTELALLREWQREVIQNANAHHAEREDAIARAERAEAELATERARLDWLEDHGWITGEPCDRAAIDAAMREGDK